MIVRDIPERWFDESRRVFSPVVSAQHRFVGYNRRYTFADRAYNRTRTHISAFLYPTKPHILSSILRCALLGTDQCLALCS